MTLGPLDNPRESPHLKILTLIIPAKSFCHVVMYRFLGIRHECVGSHCADHSEQVWHSLISSDPPGTVLYVSGHTATLGEVVSPFHQWDTRGP